MITLSLYRVFNVKSHSVTRNTLLKEIESSDGYECATDDFNGDYISKISKTNWDKVPLVNGRWPYFLVKEVNHSFVNFLEREYGAKERGWTITKEWFNQYYPNSGSDHPWHHHSRPNGDWVNGIACVYYIELKDKSLRTVLKNPKTGKEIIPRVKEGQILTFDANMYHKSPRNFSSTRKTVISFNIEFGK